jgi:hypothetical protein
LGDATADELAAIDEALSDDTLTTGGSAALNSAKTKITATQTTVKGLLSALDAADTPAAQNASDESGDDDHPCDGRNGNRGSGSGTSQGARSGGDGQDV